MRSSFFAALGAALVVACTAPTENVGSGEQASISDAVSIVRRPDGRFDVFCRGRDGAPDYTQTVEASAIHDDSVCSPPAPPRPTVVAIANRNVRIAAGTTSTVTLDQWGTDVWEGFATFDAVLTGQSGSSFSASIVDGTGASYPLSGTKTRYDRLPTPIKIVGATSYYYDAWVQLTASSVDVTKTLPIPASKLATKYNATAATTLRVVGAELPGAPITLTAEAKFFKNFTNGNSCSRVSLVDASGAATVLDPSSASRRVTLKAPLSIVAQSTCISSRLGTPESASADVEVDVTRMEIGAP